MTAIKINTFQIDWLGKFSLNNSDHEEVNLFLINLITIQFHSPKKFKCNQSVWQKHMEIYYLNF